MSEPTDDQPKSSTPAPLASSQELPEGSREFADQDRPPTKRGLRLAKPVPAGGRNKLIDRARKAFNKEVDSSAIGRIAKRMVDMALEEPDGRLALEAAKFIFNYRIGKPKQEVEITETSTLTFEERKTLVLDMLGVSEDDATLRFSQSKSTGGNLPHPGDSPSSNATALLPGPEPVSDLGEVPTSGGDVGIRVEVRRKAYDADQAAGPPV